MMNILAIVVFVILTVVVDLFNSALRRKGIPLVLQSLIIGVLFYLVNWDVVDRGIMPHYGRIWGIAHSLYFPVVIILLICGIWIFIEKHKMKKAGKKK